MQAEGQREALRLLSSVFNNNTQALIWYYFIQSLTKFNGTLIVIIMPPYNQTALTPILLPIRS